MRHLDQAVDGELLGDLVTLLSQRQVEPLRSFNDGAIHLDLLAEAVVSDAVITGLGAQHGEEFTSFELGWLAKHRRCYRLRLRCRCWRIGQDAALGAGVVGEA